MDKVKLRDMMEFFKQTSWQNLQLTRRMTVPGGWGTVTGLGCPRVFASPPSNTPAEEPSWWQREGELQSWQQLQPCLAGTPSYMDGDKDRPLR